MYEFQQANWMMVKPLALARVPTNGRSTIDIHGFLPSPIDLARRPGVSSLPCFGLSLVGLFFCSPVFKIHFLFTYIVPVAPAPKQVSLSFT